MISESYIVAPEQAGMRLDRFVVAQAPHLSRTCAQELIAAGGVRVNGRPGKPGTSLAVGDRVELPEGAPLPAVPALPAPEAVPLTVLFEDAHLLIIEKAAGMVVHPAPGHAGGTLVNALLAHTSDLGAAQTPRPGIVHRLDRDTSGLLLVAKDDPTLHGLGQQLRDHRILKEYLALVEGIMDPPAGAIEAPIGRDPRHRQRMAIVAQGGRAALTRFMTERTVHGGRPTAGRTLLRLQLVTGRTHQIRVHCAAVGHPVVGDLVYGRPQLPMPPRQFLHAAHLAFTHPITGVPMDITSPLPDDLAGFLEQIAHT